MQWLYAPSLSLILLLLQRFVYLDPAPLYPLKEKLCSLLLNGSSNSSQSSIVAWLRGFCQIVESSRASCAACNAILTLSDETMRYVRTASNRHADKVLPLPSPTYRLLCSLCVYPHRAPGSNREPLCIEKAFIDPSAPSYHFFFFFSSSSSSSTTVPAAVMPTWTLGSLGSSVRVCND